MTRLALAYAVTLVVFLVLDGGFLALVGPKLYRAEIGALMGSTVRPVPAVLFYALYGAGLLAFVVQPSLSAGWMRALIYGAGFGLVAYGTYDLTCAAVMKTWSIKVTGVDMAWGAIASGTASAVATLVVRKFGGIG